MGFGTFVPLVAPAGGGARGCGRTDLDEPPPPPPPPPPSRNSRATPEFHPCLDAGMRGNLSGVERSKRCVMVVIVNGAGR